MIRGREIIIKDLGTSGIGTSFCVEPLGGEVVAAVMAA